MLQRFKQYLIIVVILGACYFVLSHHFVFSNTTSFDILKKKELTLKNTFISLKSSPPESLLKIDELRDAGIEDILLEKGIITEGQLNQILHRIDADSK
jgi:hypothetical protein